MDLAERAFAVVGDLRVAGADKRGAAGDGDGAPVQEDSEALREPDAASAGRRRAAAAFRAVALLAFAAAVFRAEVSILLALVAADTVFLSSSLGVGSAVGAILLGATSGGLLSLGVDSLFWGR